MSNLSFRIKIEESGRPVDGLSAAVIDSFRMALAGIAKAAQAEWLRLAQARLRSSRDFYINGLRQAESFKSFTAPDGEVGYQISLVGQMANNIEHGMPSFDMKTVRPGWLGGGKARTSASGAKYVTIPFRHTTGSSPRHAYTGKAARMGLERELARTVKSYGLDRMVKTATGQVAQGVVARVPSRPDVHRYLRGLVRIQKDEGGRGRSRLMTFRVMSERSDPDSWIHPGLNAANLLEEVERFANREMGNIVATVLGR